VKQTFPSTTEEATSTQALPSLESAVKGGDMPAGTSKQA
jgi:hypothetical protein